MDNISEKDKKLWRFYTENLNSIKINKKNYNLISNKKLFVKKNISSNFNFNLGQKTIKELNQNKIFIDARLDLHGFVEVDAKKKVKKFVIECFDKGFKIF